MNAFFGCRNQRSDAGNTIGAFGRRRGAGTIVGGAGNADDDAIFPCKMCATLAGRNNISQPGSIFLAKPWLQRNNFASQGRFSFLDPGLVKRSAVARVSVCSLNPGCRKYFAPARGRDTVSSPGYGKRRALARVELLILTLARG